MSTKQKVEYVVDVEHGAGCYSPSLYVMRNVLEVTTPWIDTYDDENDGKPLAHVEQADWTTEDQLEPMQLFCSMCDAKRYVVLDERDTLLALTQENCPRSQVHHIMNYKYACEYCGYHGEERVE